MNTHYLEQQGGKIAYDDVGSGPLVVCVPSLGDVRGEYRFLAPLLVEAGYRVVSMDARGHGESSTGWTDYSVAGVGSDMVALIRTLDAGPAVIIGTSMAAGAAVWAAAEAPNLVSGMVLIGAFVRGDGNLLLNLLFGAMLTRPWGPAMWLRYFNTLYPTRKPDDFDTYSTALRDNLKEPGRIEAVKGMLYASKAASEARLPQVQAPTLIIMGSKDPDFKDPEAEAKWIAERLHATYRIVQDAGHYPHAEMPVTTAPIILDFMRTLSAQPEAVYASPN